ncbi:hypothetical protein LNV08_22925, partial [Paucibacter sp. TC2R-5]|uniref:hypothetical protein n=1 Tax=Paucibacter sp. TC2R-5 TaxID=2893555 RepID=UPI0021E3B620
MLSLSTSPAARRLSAPLLVALSLALPAGAAIAQTGETAKLAPPAPSSQAIEQVVIKLLKSRPELVRDALDELQRRELAG